MNLRQEVIIKHLESDNTLKQSAAEIGISYSTLIFFMKNQLIDQGSNDKRYDKYREWIK